MVLDLLDMDCVTDPTGKPEGEASKADKKDKGPRLGDKKSRCKK